MKFSNYALYIRNNENKGKNTDTIVKIMLNDIFLKILQYYVGSITLAQFIILLCILCTICCPTYELMDRNLYLYLFM